MVKKPKVGDVFLVPTGDGRAGVGQVVGGYGSDAFFFAIFDAVLPLGDAPASAAKGLSAPVLFVALSVDAKLHAGHWVVVDHSPVDPAIPLPAYKESVGPTAGVDVVDSSGERRRPATAAEAAALPYRKVIAPARLERALRASLGLESWLAAFDELRAEGMVSSAAIFA